MVWREPRNHSDDCYVCLLNVAGLNAKKRKTIVYPDLPSALRPVLHSEVLPVPIFKCLPELPVTILNENCAQKILAILVTINRLHLELRNPRPKSQTMNQDCLRSALTKKN